MNEKKLHDSELKGVSGGDYVAGRYYIDNDKCVYCGACYGDCPLNAIQEDAQSYYINQDICVACGNCVYCCPAKAIFRA